MKLMHWIVLLILLFVCVLPLTALETRLMVGLDVFILELHPTWGLDLVLFPMGVLESTISTPPLGGWFQLEGGLRWRTAFVRNFGDLVVRSVARFPKLSIGIEYSPVIFGLDSDQRATEWFLNSSVAIFIRLRDLHLSIVTTPVEYFYLSDWWYFLLRTEYVWKWDI
jgi:hypothetical protein